MWQAAAPVLAVIEVLCGGNIVIKRFKRYDLPVLALPVKNTLFPALMAFITAICSGIRFIWKELRRLLAGPLCSSSPQFESLSLPVVLNSFGVTPFLSCRGLFLQPTVKSLSVGGLMFSNDRALSLRSRLLLLAIPFCLLWASFNDRHFKNVASWFGGQFRNIIWIFCVRGLMVAFPSCKNRLWMVNSFRRKVFPNGDWLLAMSRNSSRPSLYRIKSLKTFERNGSFDRKESVVSFTFKFCCPMTSTNHMQKVNSLQSSLSGSNVLLVSSENKCGHLDVFHGIRLQFVTR